MLNLSIKFPTDFSLKLYVGKGKKGFYGTLYYQSTKGTKTDINTFLASDFTDFDIQSYENMDLDVVINEKKIFHNNTLILECENLFKRGTLLNLVNREQKTGKRIAVVCIDNLPLTVVSHDDLPANLFERRNAYRLSVIDDEHLTIVRYANLHQHTEYSLLDGICKVSDLAKKTEHACAITDHGNMSGILDFYSKMKGEGKKPIIGVEAYVESVDELVFVKDGSDDVFSRMFDDSVSADEIQEEGDADTKLKNGDHLILLAKTEKGMKNLFKLSTLAEGNKRKGNPHVKYEWLREYSEDIIATSACIGGTLGKSVKNRLSLQKDPFIANAIKEYGYEFYNQVSVKDSDKAKVLAYKKNYETGIKFIETMIEIFGKDDFYIEIQDHHFELETEIMKEVKRLGKQYGLKLMIGIDAHYLNKEDAYVHELWLCQQTKRTIDDPKRMQFSGDGYFVHTSDDVVDLFKDDPDMNEMLDNTLEIADKCNVVIEHKGYKLPGFPVPEGYENDKEYFLALCRQKYREKFAGTDKYRNKEYLERMKFEIDTIVNMGFWTYFLIVQDYIAWSKDANIKDHLETYFPKSSYNWDEIPPSIIKDYVILVGPGRGSGAGSLVCYCLGITDLDPIEYGLLFERFLNPDRVSMPDIDVDFEDSLRQKVIDYVKYKYGADHVSRIITYGTAAAKAAVKDVMRIMGLPISDSQALSDAIPNRPKITLDEALAESNDFANFYAMPEYKKVIDIAKKFEGLRKNKGQHACGVIISPSPVTDFMPQCMLVNTETGEAEPTTQFVMTECEDMGLLKMDFLGLRTLGVIHEATDLIKNEKIDPNNIDIYDLSVYKHLADGNTDAVFQLESPYMSGLIQNMYQQIDSEIDKLNEYPEEQRALAKQDLAKALFAKVCDANALGRPGPMDEIPHYINNMLNPDDVSYEIPQTEEYLKATNGIIVYQEQTMMLTRKLAGFTPGQADKIRKAMGKKIKTILDEYGQYFVYGSKQLGITGCVNNGIGEKEATEIWAKMEKFGEYAFNKSHSVAYSILTARTAWLSKYYPVEFMTATLNSFIDNIKIIKKYLSSCKRQNIKILGPSISESEQKFTCKDGTIRFGLGGIKGLGSISTYIISERNENGDFKSYEDFLTRMSSVKSFGKKAVESLVYSGALDEFGGTRKEKIDQLEKSLDYIKESKKVNSLANKDIWECLGISEAQGDQNKLVQKTGERFSNREMLNKEFEYTSFYITGHPLDEFKTYIKATNSVKLESLNFVEDINSLIEKENGQQVPLKTKNLSFVGVITTVDEKISKKGNAYANVIIEDETGMLSASFYASNYETFKEFIVEGNCVSIKGKVDVDDNSSIRLIVNDLQLLNEDANIIENLNINKHCYGELKPYLQSLKKGSCSIIMKDFSGKSESYTIKQKFAISTKELCEIQDLLGSQNIIANFKKG